MYKTNVIFNEDINHIMSFVRAYIQDLCQISILDILAARQINNSSATSKEIIKSGDYQA